MRPATVMRPVANDGIIHILHPSGEFPPIPAFAEVWRRYMLKAPDRFSLKDIEDLGINAPRYFPNRTHA